MNENIPAGLRPVLYTLMELEYGDEIKRHKDEYKALLKKHLATMEEYKATMERLIPYQSKEIELLENNNCCNENTDIKSVESSGQEYTLTEAAKKLDVHKSTVSRRAAALKLGTPVGRNVIVLSQAEVDQLAKVLAAA